MQDSDTIREQPAEQALEQAAEMPAWVPAAQSIVGAVAPLAAALLIATHYKRAMSMLSSARFERPARGTALTRDDDDGGGGGHG